MEEKEFILNDFKVFISILFCVLFGLLFLDEDISKVVFIRIGVDVELFICLFFFLLIIEIV